MAVNHRRAKSGFDRQQLRDVRGIIPHEVPLGPIALAMPALIDRVDLPPGCQRRKERSKIPAAAGDPVQQNQRIAGKRSGRHMQLQFFKADREGSEHGNSKTGVTWVIT